MTNPMTRPTTRPEATRPLRMTKHGLAENPVGLHVIYDYLGSTLLGEVVSSFYREYGCAGTYLTVRNMDGSPWPIEPSARIVRALCREYRQEADRG